MSTEEVKDHTGKPSMKRKLAWRSFITSQIIAGFIVGLSVYGIISDKELIVPVMMENVFWTFIGASLTFSGFNISEYYSKLTEKKE